MSKAVEIQQNQLAIYKNSKTSAEAKFFAYYALWVLNKKIQPVLDASRSLYDDSLELQLKQSLQQTFYAVPMLVPLKSKTATAFFREHFETQFGESINLDILDLAERCEDALLSADGKPDLPRLMRVLQLQNTRQQQTSKVELIATVRGKSASRDQLNRLRLLKALVELFGIKDKQRLCYKLVVA